MHLRSLFHHALLLLQLAGAVTATTQYDHQIDELLRPDEELKVKKRENGGSYAVTGVLNGVTPSRLEIRELQKNADMFNIYLLGLARFQAVRQDDPLSYYSICGIHGRPYIPWDNVQPGNGNPDTGYCTHVSNLILSWHRIFILLFEQVLYEHMVECVNEFPPGEVRDRYARAVLNMRLPYWDWSKKVENESVWPKIFSQPTVQVNTPKGTKTIDNPLFSYKFHPVVEQDIQLEPFIRWQSTLRAPDTEEPDASSQNDQVNEEFENQWESYRDRIFNLLIFYDNFTQFSNQAWFDDQENVDSLESLHDAIHGFCGKSGHMTYLDFAAFDPAFVLHHTHLDHIYALWTVLHPNYEIEPMVAQSDTFTYKAGEVIDGNTPLNPFSRDRDGHKWTANMVNDTKALGYAYEETQTNDANYVRKRVYELYGAGYLEWKKTHKRGLLSDGLLSDVLGDIPNLVNGLEIDGLKIHGLEVDGRQRRYTAIIRSNKHAYRCSYAIYIFVGPFDHADPSSWPLSPNLAGTHALFTSLHPDNSTHARRSIVTGGEVHLNAILLAKFHSGELSSMDENTVKAYLSVNLHWRVATFDNQQIPLEDVADLQVTVAVNEIKLADSEFDTPTRHNFKMLHGITKNRLGGY